MKALLQRVTFAKVEVDHKIVGEIDVGVLAFLAVERDDTSNQVDRMLERVLGYRIFHDTGGRMNLSVRDTGGGLLVVPQFTLAADTKKGMRPSFTPAALPEIGEPLFRLFVEKARQEISSVASGVFGAYMQVTLCNDGPVTFLL